MVIEKISTSANWEKHADTNYPNRGVLFTNKISRTDASDDALGYILPAASLSQICFDITGDGKVELTNDSPKEIEAGNASYITWNEASEINPGITGFRINWTSGTVTVVVSIRTLA